jgi:hypothetical protein
MALHEKEKRRLTGHYQPANCSMTVQMNVCSAGQASQCVLNPCVYRHPQLLSVSAQRNIPDYCDERKPGIQ